MKILNHEEHIWQVCGHGATVWSRFEGDRFIVAIFLRPLNDHLDLSKRLHVGSELWVVDGVDRRPASHAPTPPLPRSLVTQQHLDEMIEVRSRRPNEDQDHDHSHRDEDDFDDEEDGGQELACSVRSERPRFYIGIFGIIRVQPTTHIIFNLVL